PRPRWRSRAGPGSRRACACRHRDRRDRLRRRGLRVAAGDARSRARGDRAGGGMSRPADRDEALATDALTRVPVAEEGRARWLSANPDKAWGERFFLLYSPIWMVAFGAYQRTRIGDRLGDLGNLLVTLATFAP